MYRFLVCVFLILALPLKGFSDRSLIDRDLVFIDVGCRWGFADPFLENLDLFNIYGFDPDIEECKRLEAMYNSDRIHLVPLGLSDKIGQAKLFVTAQPACSSMYQPNPLVIKSFECTSRELADAKEVDINVVTLDHWAEKAGIKHIDHIKLDTQGSELLIFKGADHMLDTVRTIEVEVEFNPIYKDQPLFSDVDQYLRSRGFVLLRFKTLIHYCYPGEKHLSIREFPVKYNDVVESTHARLGQLYFADAYYVRKEMLNDEPIELQQLLRDIVLTKSLGFHDVTRRLGRKYSELSR